MKFLKKIQAKTEPSFVKEVKNLLKWCRETSDAMEERQSKLDIENAETGFEYEALKDNLKHLAEAWNLLEDVDFHFSKINEDFLGD